MERKNAICILPAQAGMTLLDLLAARFSYRDRDGWWKELRDGRFRLNNGPAGPETIPAAGDLLVYDMGRLVEPPVDFGYTVLHEDHDLLVVNKPAPLPCHPGGRFFRHTLWAALREKYGSGTPLFVNRLDRETSGVLLLARNRQTARLCQQQFAGQEVEKRYLAIVEGDFPAGETRAAGWLAPDERSLIRKKRRFLAAGSDAPANGLSCRTTFRLLVRHNGLSLVEAQPHSGRCHQIRATLLGLGFPVTGDKLYGVDENLFLRFRDDAMSEEDVRRLRLPRQALHAASLTLRHPGSGEKISFAAPLPEMFGSLLPDPEGGIRPPLPSDHSNP